jgi:hypothetical protein
MDITPAVKYAAAIAIGLFVGGCEPALIGPSATRPSAVADPTAAAEALLLAPWRPAPVDIEDDLLASIKFVCSNPGEPDIKAAIETLPVAVVDARGGGLASIVLADEHAAFECRVRLEPIGGTLGATIIDKPSRLDPESSKPVEDDGIAVISHTRIDEDAGSRTILIGRVGPKAFSAGVGFNDESEVVAAKDNGWFYAWWPGTKEPGAIVSTDMRNIVLDSAPSPETEIEGRVGPAAWWVDPTAAPLPPTATSVPALIRERACASGQSPEGRVVDPAVFSSENAVLVTVWVRHRTGGQDCPGNPAFPMEIRLPDALGDRTLLDGSTIPPRDASVPEE